MSPTQPPTSLLTVTPLSEDDCSTPLKADGDEFNALMSAVCVGLPFVWAVFLLIQITPYIMS